MLHYTYTAKGQKISQHYPFGMAIPSQSCALPNENNTYQNRYLYNGKEFQDDFGLNWYDYGARFYDAQIGRWHSVDPAAALYYNLSPYHYGGNSPINTIDIDGRLFIYVNGFMYDHWKPWSGTTYAPDRNFYSDAPRNAGETFSYWYRIPDEFAEMFEDPNMLFTSGSFKPWTMGGTRFSEGYKQAQVLIDMLESGEVTLQDGETIKIVGHSHGAAYAAGLATALLEHPKYKHLLEFVLYFAPDQPNQFSHPEGVPGYQFSTKSDLVSSTGPLAWLRDSKYSLIDGSQWALEREKYSGSRGGHGMDSLIREILDWAKNYGIPVYVFE